MSENRLSLTVMATIFRLLISRRVLDILSSSEGS